ncbi:hypothetical protein HYC85_008300 [Camellia sinensis]|uniref:Mannan endo-1,4-beta-mannosidase n=1 Tax=Camellia sinensis TaxID=4442 RepID=A0A7J7HTQ6_CAMSI|nr:hypothetical protein HYC85_008300 [Camellia sinensis]
MATAHSTRRHTLLCFCIFLSSILSLSHGRLTPNFKIRAVNLGGWLVAEGWIKPSLFDGIPNKDFLDGTGLQFKAVTAGKYLCAETGGGSIIVANRTVASSWETFKLWRINETNYQLRVFNKQFVGVDSGGNGIDMVAIVADTPGRSETYANNPRLYAVELINEPLSPGATLESLNKYYRAGYNAVRKYSSTVYVIMSNRIATSDPKEFFSLASGLDRSVIDIHYYNLYSSNFDQMSVQQNINFIYNNRLPELNQLTTSNGPLTFIENLVTADSKGDGSWGNDDQYVFIVTNTGGLHGEFQLTNGYGPVNAPQEHWNTFIVEDDFNFISSNGINAVRIPIGWWIACDPTPPQPYVGGSLQALDNAFIWAQKYGINVIIDLHAAPGSQNGNEHSSSRDGSQEWGLSDQNIQETANVIDFLTSRYANNPTFYAVELINEPLSPGASLDSLNKYYSAGYNVVRKYSSTAYVIMSNRLGAIDPQELFPIASSLEGSVIDIHYYNLFSNSFNNMSVQQNIDFIYNNRSAQLNQVTTSNGPLTFIGEWVAEWKVSGVAKKDYQRFGKAQLEVYGRASFGWAYWTLKNVNNHWSLKWMINNGYIKF